MRLARGLTQGALAHLVCAEIEKATGRQAAVEAQTISRIERGVITWPNQETRRALRAVLQAESDEDLGLYAKRTHADAERMGATKRRDLLALAAISAVAPPTGRIGMSDVNAMRDRLKVIQMDGVVVIGEGEKDEAPMLYIGERIGNGQEPKVDVAVDPVDGTTLLSKGLPNAVAVVALAEQGSMYNPPGIVYMEKLAVGPAG